LHPNHVIALTDAIRALLPSQGLNQLVDFGFAILPLRVVA
jgi:hypothetical protein